MTPRRFAQILLVVAVIAVLATVASACPNCKEAVADNSAAGSQGAFAGGDAAGGFNNAIFFALGTVFTLIGGLGWRVYRAVNRGPAQ
jgi:opacity protein-like surface antigen